MDNEIRRSGDDDKSDTVKNLSKTAEIVAPAALTMSGSQSLGGANGNGAVA